MGGVGAWSVATRGGAPSPPRPPPRSAGSPAAGMLDSTVNPRSATSVTRHTALRAGSSQHGTAARAALASNCVAASRRAAPSLPFQVDR